MQCCIKDPDTLMSYEIDKDLKRQQAAIRRQVCVGVGRFCLNVVRLLRLM